MAKTQHTSVGYFDSISHFSLLIWWHHKQSLKAIGVLGYPITIFMENGQAQYRRIVNRDYLVAILKRCIMVIANGYKKLLL